MRSTATFRLPTPRRQCAVALGVGRRSVHRPWPPGPRQPTTQGRRRIRSSESPSRCRPQNERYAALEYGASLASVRKDPLRHAHGVVREPVRAHHRRLSASAAPIGPCVGGLDVSNDPLRLRPARPHPPCRGRQAFCRGPTAVAGHAMLSRSLALVATWTRPYATARRPGPRPPARDRALCVGRFRLGNPWLVHPGR